MLYIVVLITHAMLDKSDEVSFIGRFLRLRRNTHWHNHASFDSLLSSADLGNLGKGWIVRGTTTRTVPYG